MSLFRYGQRVRVTPRDVTVIEQLQSLTNLEWVPKMAQFLGKIGIVSLVREEEGAVLLRFFTTAEDIGDGGPRQGFPQVVETIYEWRDCLLMDTPQLQLG